jgi:2-dehydro-3-deoxygluconokinase
MQSKKVVTFGEVMMRLSTPGFARFQQAKAFNVIYGGGEANVAISLAAFNQPAQHITRFPDNDIGHAATSYIRSLGVDTSAIQYGGDRIGIYFLETGAALRSSKVVYDRFNSAFALMPADCFDWDSILENTVWFHFTGITPAISQQAFNQCLQAVKAAKQKGITVSCDVSYRKNLWQYGVTPQEAMPKLIEHCDVIFAGKSDIRDIFAVELAPEDKFAQAAEKMMFKYPNLKKIINSKRDSNSASDNTISGVVYVDGALLETPKYKVMPIIDRVGGGDAFAAGYIYGALHLSSEQEAINFAAAASAFKHTVEGDANICSVDEVLTIMRGDTSGKIIR